MPPAQVKQRVRVMGNPLPTGEGGDGGRTVADSPGFSRAPKTKATYEARIEKLFAGEKAQLGTAVLDRSDVMGLLGYPDVPLMLNERHLIDGFDSHPEMTAEMWRRVPEWIKNPEAVYTEPKHPGRLTIIGPERLSGVPVVMAVEPNPTPAMRGKAVPFQLVVTAFAKTSGNLPSLQNLAANGELLYADTKNAQEIWRRAGDNPQTGRPIQGRVKILTVKQLGAPAARIPLRVSGIDRPSLY